MRTESVLIPILMYHSIAADADPRFRRWTVRPAHFANQLAYLMDTGYTPITVSHLRAAFAGELALPPRPVVLTFDDGFADFHTTVLPLLSARRMTATLYLATGHINGTSAWLAREGEADRPLLTWGQINEVLAAGIEIGAHSHTHTQLDILSTAAATQEITRPRREIGDHTGVLVTSFAYPFGYFSAANRRAVRDAGYTSACAVKYAMSGTDDDPFALSRLIVTADTSLDSFAALLTTPTAHVTRTLERTRAGIWRSVRTVGHAGRRRAKR